MFIHYYSNDTSLRHFDMDMYMDVCWLRRNLFEFNGNSLI